MTARSTVRCYFEGGPADGMWAEVHRPPAICHAEPLAGEAMMFAAVGAYTTPHYRRLDPPDVPPTTRVRAYVWESPASP